MFSFIIGRWALSIKKEIIMIHKRSLVKFVADSGAAVCGMKLHIIVYCYFSLREARSKKEVTAQQAALKEKAAGKFRTCECDKGAAP